ncbi:hypothetical protein K439DRAFT_1378077, partial [Ramaria rubella]
MPASDGGYYCNCTKHCKRYKKVSRSTWFEHKKYHNQIPDLPGTSEATANSRSLETSTL